MRPKPKAEPPPAPEPPPLRLTSEGTVDEATVCRELNIAAKRLRWLMRIGHVVPAVPARRGREERFFLSAIQDAIRLTSYLFASNGE